MFIAHVTNSFQILIGPSDWEDYFQGKEGSAKYRIHNLPKKSGPGVYELGIAVSRSGLGRKVYKLDPDRIVVVYLGQADNVRTRLQQYGRTGAHLGNSCSSYDPDDCNPISFQKGLGLFEEIFSQGLPIIYRWAPVSTYIRHVFLFMCLVYLIKCVDGFRKLDGNGIQHLMLDDHNSLASIFLSKKLSFCDQMQFMVAYRPFWSPSF